MTSTISIALYHTDDGKVIIGYKQYPSFLGIENIGYIWHNTWSDPELEYNGKIFNYYDVMDSMYSDYEEYMTEYDIEDTDENFKLYVLDNLDYLYELFDNLIECGKYKVEEE